MDRTELDEYLMRRAAQERVAAKLADDPLAARSHLEMAKRYGAMADEAGSQESSVSEDGAMRTSDFRIIP